MPKRPLKSKITRTNLTPAWRRFWETGEVPKDSSDESCEIFLLNAWPGHCRDAWKKIREEILAGWNKKRLPWGAREFDKK